MLWIKALHVMFVVAWFAGLFYLPRLFVYHADTNDEPGIARFRVMERRLLSLTHLAGTLAVFFGLATLAAEPALARLPWMQVKLVLVAGLIGYHVWCARLVQGFARGRPAHSSRWYRLFNELPALFLAGIVVLVIVRPF
jgi:protoporphyrinogen IX oxidase